jgi:hypothetical protein
LTIARRVAGLLAVAVLAWAPPASALAGPFLLFRLSGAQLDEISGIAAGIASPGVVYVQNDSGDSARFFALDKRTGALLATYHVPGATNVDWEDIAVAPDAQGTSSVWLADIGDNDAQRAHVQLYRVDEPHVDTSRRAAELSTARPQVWQLRYPDGPHDAESLAVSPAGVAYIFTKSALGDTSVYVAPAQAGPAALRRIGTITFSFTGTPGPFAPLGELAATGADLSRSGTRLVVRTYTDAYLWTVTGGDVAAALRQAPQRIALPRQPQGEGICFDGSRLLTDSEGVGSAVYAVPLPATAPRPVATSPAVSRPAPGPSTQHPTPAGALVRGARGSGAGWWWLGVPLVVVGAVGAVGAVGIVAVTVRRRRTRGGRS